MAKVKITVVKKVNNTDLYGDNPPAECASQECDAVELGQEFIVEDLYGYPAKCPPGFCASAFTDIYRHIAHLLLGGDCPWMKEKGVALLRCIDGCVSVIFKLERIED